MTDAPPRLARRLLTRVLPEDVRDAIDGDLLELFARRRAERGRTAASIWYWLEALSFTGRFGLDGFQRFMSWLLRGDAPSGLDLKLGARMLIKYPGLAIVGGLGMAVGIAVGTGAHTFFNEYMHAPLPLHEGDRIVALINVTSGPRGDEQRTLHDFIAWRDQMKSVVQVSAFRTVSRELTGARGPVERVRVAEMSASGFAVARVAPLLGRPLLESDEMPGAPNVIVIGHGTWQSQFDGDSAVLGQTLRLAGTPHTVVGVMPSGFRFPVNHDYWVPLRLQAASFEYGRGPALDVFARLAPGVSRAEAQAELAVIGERTAAEQPTVRAMMRPRIVRFTSIFTGDGADPSWVLSLANAALTLVLVLVCANVAILVYARTTTRAGEIAVRTALGASRTRIVAQLFAEAAVLALVASLFGLAIVAFGLQQVKDAFEPLGGLPFWAADGLSVKAVLYAVFLALFGALIIGVLPALRATGSQLRSALGRLSGGTRPQLGKTWTVLIVTQVAITVATLPPATYIAGLTMQQAGQRIDLPEGDFLVATPRLDREDDPVTQEERETPQYLRNMSVKVAEYIGRLEAEPAVAGVTFAEAVPGQEWGEGFDVFGSNIHPRTTAVRVSTTYPKTFDLRPVAGRVFDTQDVAAGVIRPMMVNRTFAEETFGSVASALGRRLRVRQGREDSAPHPWGEIIGVVEDFPAVGFGDPGDPRAKVYLPVTIDELPGAQVMVRLGTDASARFSARMRELASAVDPMLQMRQVQSLASYYRDQKHGLLLLTLAVFLAMTSIVLLSGAGVYALMSFTVTQRQREIGIRVALGAGRRRILLSILSRAVWQLAVGIGAGLVLTYTVDALVLGLYQSPNRAWLLPAVTVFVATVGAIATLGPARRILSIQPTDALRSE
jgi:putative ABC transport system permease protein